MIKNVAKKMKTILFIGRLVLSDCSLKFPKDPCLRALPLNIY